MRKNRNSSRKPWESPHLSVRGVTVTTHTSLYASSDVEEATRRRVGTIVELMQRDDRAKRLGKTWNDVCALLNAYRGLYRGLSCKLKDLDRHSVGVNKASVSWEEAISQLADFDTIVGAEAPEQLVRSLLLAMRDDAQLTGKPQPKKSKKRPKAHTRRQPSHLERYSL
jgi:hypothetical protein